MESIIITIQVILFSTILLYLVYIVKHTLGSNECKLCGSTMQQLIDNEDILYCPTCGYQKDNSDGKETD